VGWCECSVPGPAQKEAARGCGTLQEARHGGDPAVEHRRWCSRSCSGLRVLGSSAKGWEGVASAHRGSGRVETARRGRWRRVRCRSSAVRPCLGRCRGSPGLLVHRGGPCEHCKGVTGFRSFYGPTAARNCLGIGSPAVSSVRNYDTAPVEVEQGGSGELHGDEAKPLRGSVGVEV